METILEERLARQGRWIRLCLVALVVEFLMLAGATAWSIARYRDVAKFRLLYARSLTLMDSTAPHSSGVVGAGVEGLRAAVYVTDLGSRGGIFLERQPDGRQGLLVTDSHGRMRVFLGLHTDGKTALELRDADGKLIGLNENGEGSGAAKGAGSK